jgi:hypothetical protein
MSFLFPCHAVTRKEREKVEEFFRKQTYFNNFYRLLENLAKVNGNFFRSRREEERKENF